MALSLVTACSDAGAGGSELLSEMASGQTRGSPLDVDDEKGKKSEVMLERTGRH